MAAQSGSGRTKSKTKAAAEAKQPELDINKLINIAFDLCCKRNNLSEEEWMEELLRGCQSIGRNLNDTRGLMHSFRDTREVMRRLFSDLGDMQSSDFRKWEICFELRIKRARYIRIYTDVLVITDNKVFSLEFKMKDTIDPDEERQAVKYAKYLEIIFGPEYDVISALVLTKTSDLYAWQPLPGSTAQLPVCSGEMLFNLFDEYIGFLE